MSVYPGPLQLDALTERLAAWLDQHAEALGQRWRQLIAQTNGSEALLEPEITTSLGEYILAALRARLQGETDQWAQQAGELLDAGVSSQALRKVLTRLVPVTRDLLAEGEEQQAEALVHCLGEQVLALQLDFAAEQARRGFPAPAQEHRQLKEFFQNVINALPLRLLVLDENLHIIHTNPAYTEQRGVTQEEIVGQPVEEVFPPELLEEAGLRKALENTLATRERVWWSGFREQTTGHPERIVNIRIDPCPGPEGRPCLLVTIEDVSDRYRQVYERALLQEISHAMLSTLDLPRLLHAILTGMTAGGVAGLGFNRAILMLVDEPAGLLKAEMAVGPESVGQAQHIWSEISSEYRTLQDFLKDYDQLPPPEERPLAELVDHLAVPLTNTEHLPISALVNGKMVHVQDAEADARVNPEFGTLLNSREFVVAPLLMGERWIGVAVADNFVTSKPIRGYDIHLLSSLANHAALAIDRAQLYREAQDRAEELAQAYDNLKAAEQELLRNERLVTIGQVTAAVAHEIRNPLTTIGGFARSIVRDPEKKTRRNAQIIVEEVDRLEELLRGVLDFSRPESLQMQRVHLQPVLESVVALTAGERRHLGIELRWEISHDLPEVDLDVNQFRQVLFNLVKNAIEAMPEGGVLTIGSRSGQRGVEVFIKDTGPGIPEADLGHIFENFFTTKPTGTGLGLALTRKILDAHRADIEVASTPGEGSTFTIILPYPSSETDEQASP